LPKLVQPLFRLADELFQYSLYASVQGKAHAGPQPDDAASEPLLLAFDFLARAALSAWERRPPFFLILKPNGAPYTREHLSWHEPWSLEHIQLAQQHARVDLARVVTLAVHTGQRGSDIVRMRWSDIEEQDGRQGVNVIQQKTGHWNDERDNNPALKPLSEAGLVIHGLRATAVVRARRAGATVLEIASMYGMTEPTVARYSRLADQRDMALGAVVRLDRTAKEQTKAQTKQTSFQRGK
jgi:integrase